ncbi:helix-turn-helix domain-containing protein [uncultured Pigmentiphaga sp.]|uniref:helix-turn-helix domain-containing protein n=1 Tax=uncultured Pigmentiphaga sp. TaxID=340361 RepID=UPI00341283B3
MTLQEAAAYLGFSYSTIYAYRKQIGFQLTKRGRWRVWPSRLACISKKDNNVARLSMRVVGDTPWPSAEIKIPASTRSISARQAAKELDARLAQATSKRRGNITTT